MHAVERLEIELPLLLARRRVTEDADVGIQHEHASPSEAGVGVAGPFGGVAFSSRTFVTERVQRVLPVAGSRQCSVRRSPSYDEK